MHTNTFYSYKPMAKKEVKVCQKLIQSNLQHQDIFFLPNNRISPNYRPNLNKARSYQYDKTDENIIIC